MLEFQKQQARFTAHLRDPDNAPAPGGIEDRRLNIYRELFYNNIEGFLANAFPVLHLLLEPACWHAMVRDFFARHRSADPLFQGLAEEFVRYLDDERGTLTGDPPFLRELAHYEWVELALSVAEDTLTPALADPNGDLLDGVPLVSPLAWTLAYDYPVHRIGPNFQPQLPDAQPTLLIVWRNRADEVKFMEINAVTARLMELLGGAAPASGRELLLQIAAEASHPDPQQLLREGADLLQGLRMRDILLGACR